jgi:uncharacterized protein YecT (DUF1311 family)
MKKRLACFFAVALAAFAPIWAQTAPELNEASNQAGAAADKKLNAAYQSLIKEIESGDKRRASMVLTQLREAQRAWLKYRDAQVSFVGAYNDIGSSSARNAGMSSYSVELTGQRIKDLKEVPNPF